MINATVTLKSISPYSQSRFHDTPKLERELADDYERRTWKERLHTADDGRIFIPPMAFKNCLAEAAKYMSKAIPGKGKATYTKHFEAGVLVVEGLTLDKTKDDAISEWLFVPADGIRGSGKRVKKCFPLIREWGGKVNFVVLDELITESVFREILEGAGQFIGIGRFRPKNNGYYGRFEISNLKWAKA